MTKREREDERILYRQLEAFGLTPDEIDTLQRASRTLHRWAERECNGEVERDDDTGRTYGTNAGSPYATKTVRWRVPDRETGALRRVRAILATKSLWFYHQGDPRGAALYIGRASDLKPGDRLDAVYTRGIAIC